MARAALEAIERQVEWAYRADPEHSMLANLDTVRAEDWDALPEGAERSIADITEHVAWCKFMYADYGFGSASLDGRTLAPPARDMDSMRRWLDEGQETWLAAVRSLRDDSDLADLRLSSWGERLPAERLISIMLAHDTYHAGEINRQRSLLQGGDRWAFADD